MFNIIQYILLIILSLISVVSIIAICLQRPKEIGLGAGFTSGYGTNFRTSIKRNTETKLMVLTAVLGLLIILITIVWFLIL